MPIVTPKYESLQYDGTNGPQIVGEWLASVTLVSDDGQTLVFQDRESSTYTMQVGDWVIRTPADRWFPRVVTAADYALSWVELP
ncbi:MAG TPA: hypothetical protein VIP28_10590 [Nocardioides sp.]